MSQVTITINSREYAVACEDGQEMHILDLAKVLDDKAKLLTQASGQINENMLLAMVGLLVADELTELKKGNPLVVSNPDAVDKSEIAKTDDFLASRLNLLAEQIKSNHCNIISIEGSCLVRSFRRSAEPTL